MNKEQLKQFNYPFEKKILFFGDSLTFGFNADTNDRHNRSNRWTTIVAEQFLNYEFIVEGQGGRTIAEDDGDEGKNGIKAFTQALYSQLYCDYIFIMLGTNNLKSRLRTDAISMANKFRDYKNKLEDFYNDWEVSEIAKSKIILIAPPRIDEKYIPSDWGFSDSQAISNDLATEYKKIARELGWDFIDTSEIKVSKKDGVHLDIEGNRLLAGKVSEYLKEKII